MRKKSGGGGRPKRPNDAGVLPTNYPKPTRWKLDQDYLDKLSPSERAWYAAFLDGHYGGDHRGQPGLWTQQMKRDSWAEQRAGRQDAYTLAALGGGPDEIPTDADEDLSAQDWSATPGYLDSPEYKAARDEYRSHLQQNNRGGDPEPTPELEKARRVLSVTTPTIPVFPTAPQRKRKKTHARKATPKVGATKRSSTADPRPREAPRRRN